MNEPKNKFRAGTITATVWENTIKKEDGQEIEMQSITIDRSYKDKLGNWQRTSNFNISDLPKLILVAQKAFESLTLVDDLKTKNPEATSGVTVERVIPADYWKMTDEEKQTFKSMESIGIPQDRIIQIIAEQRQSR